MLFVADEDENYDAHKLWIIVGGGVAGLALLICMVLAIPCICYRIVRKSYDPVNQSDGNDFDSLQNV